MGAKERDRQVLRADAARNRERLVSAGREVFAQRGLDATLNDVAHHAGVGVGTAYRRFANKDELIDAVMEQQNDELEAILRKGIAVPDPWEGLVFYLEQATAMHARDRGLAQVLSGRHARPQQYDRNRDRLAGLVDQIANQARSAEVLRADVTGTDLIFLQIAMSSIAGVTRDGPDIAGRDDTNELYRRYLHIALDGMRAQPTTSTSLPVPALSTADAHALLQPRRGRR